MKKLKRIFLILISIVAILFVSLYVFLQTTKPSYEGEIVLKNISKETKVLGNVLSKSSRVLANTLIKLLLFLIPLTFFSQSLFT
jgi:preprotein translocase subunit SecG